MQIFHEVTEFFTHLKIIFLNYFKSRNLRKNKLLTEGDLIFRRGERSDLKKITELHEKLFGRPFLEWLLKLYVLRSHELVSVAVNSEGEIVAYDMFMFEPAEIKDNILHELFVGVAPEYQNQGLAGRLRKYSVDCYNEGKTVGLSTLSPFSNVKALRSAQKAGYAITKASAKPAAYYLFRYLKTKSC